MSRLPHNSKKKQSTIDNERNIERSKFSPFEANRNETSNRFAFDCGDALVPLQQAGALAETPPGPSDFLGTSATASGGPLFSATITAAEKTRRRATIYCPRCRRRRRRRRRCCCCCCCSMSVFGYFLSVDDFDRRENRNENRKKKTFFFRGHFPRSMAADAFFSFSLHFFSPFCCCCCCCCCRCFWERLTPPTREKKNAN